MTSVSVDIPLRHLRVGITLPPLASRGILLNGHDSDRWIRKRKDLIGWTFSFHVEYLRYFKQLIVGVSLVPSAKLKVARNNHTKCYIDKREMLIGSFNLSHPTIEDLCVVIKDPSLIAHMRIQFRKHWKTL
jgi:hypothetical protein